VHPSAARRFGNTCQIAGVKVVTMKRVKLRWLLPFGHAVIDCILLVSLIAYSNRMFRQEKGVLYHSAAIQAALFLQEGESVEWDPVTLPPPGPFMLIMSGNLPAGLVSGALRPQARIIRRECRWDRIWFLLQEVAAFASWYLIGFWVDAGRSRLGKVMIAYLAVRFLIALTGASDAGWRFQVLFWLGFTLWLMAVGVSRLIRVALHTAKRA
jgi:hypothetical protein